MWNCVKKTVYLLNALSLVDNQRFFESVMTETEKRQKQSCCELTSGR